MGIANWLRSRGALSGKELTAQVDAIAQRFFDIERKSKDLIERKKDHDALQRTRTRKALLHNKTDLTDRTPTDAVENLPSFGFMEFRDNGLSGSAPSYAAHHEAPSGL